MNTNRRRMLLYELCTRKSIEPSSSNLHIDRETGRRFASSNLKLELDFFFQIELTEFNSAEISFKQNHRSLDHIDGSSFV